MHCPFTQFAEALGNAFWQFGQVHAPPMHTCPCGQTLPHAPQFFPSVAIVDSQPSIATWLQSAYPGLHEPRMQLPLEHWAAACGRFPQETPQSPQLVGSEETEVSQPSIGSLLQSANPKVHAAS